MGEIIQAAELGIGDLYRVYSTMANDHAGGAIVREVTGFRIVRSAETYTVLVTVDIETGTKRGEISLRSDRGVERLERIDRRDLLATLDLMARGESINVVRAHGAFWC